MSNVLKIKEADIEIEVNYEEVFNEEENNERVIQKIQEKKSSFLSKWFPSVFSSSEPTKFKPSLLSNDEYIKKGNECLNDVIQLLNANEWNEYKKGKIDGDVVETLQSDKFGKVYLITGIVECPAAFLFDEFVNKVEDTATWNPTILEGQFIKKINNETDITYQLTSGGGGGAVKPRDFVSLRHNIRKDDKFFSCSTSVEFPGYPPNKKYIRGENKISCWSMQPVPPKDGSNEMRCKLQWLSCCDLKGWIPQYVLDVAFSTTLLDFIETTRMFIEKKRLTRAF